ncbi:hypothetical protein Taro_035101 [Colocasia esculenta]|uniref:Fungal lipase-type domain-containing protein n=1 Tax=Colocasia esculenta TaxID=4460 RepID=A0A843WC65_COLES|nr:hypothetical protein [Colocasia esculenta]
MESLCFRSPHALLGVLSPPIAGFGLDVRANHPPGHVSAVGRSGAAGAAVENSTAPSGSRRSYYMFPVPLLRLWPGKSGGDEREKEAVASPEVAESEEREEEDKREGGEAEEELQQQGTAAPVAERRENWVLKILRVRSILAAEDRKPGGRGDGDGVLRQQEEDRWARGGESGDRILDGEDRCLGCCDAEGSEGCFVGEDEGEVKMDRDLFSKLLRRVSLEEVRQFAHLSYLGSLAYTVSRIKPANLLRYHRLRFVTSSFVKKSKLANVEKVQSAAQDQELQQGQAEKGEKCEKQQKNGPLISASAAYEIAASAASYLQSQTRNILPFRSSKSDSGASSAGGGNGYVGENLTNPEVTSFMATTSSVTAVVAAKEETKRAVAKDLNSARSSPCEWFICDDDTSGTRFFVIQGSESLASWKANLLFEPIQFEGLDVLVHRGIYEAAKGIYEQMLPEVREHLKSRGDSATFRFTGHSLGGSLALLVNLMLLIRGEVPASSLLPVVTFGAPSIMCGGDSLLRKLGLPSSHVQAITMHRDIVPRAFSCNYPDHVAEILKAVNGNFRNHPCLNHQKLLYAPMGEFLILQPEEKFSPHHHLLPSGTGLHVLGRKSSNSDDSARLLRAAQTVFLNSPHPLEMLSDREAYGSEGTVYRDHDVNAYLRSVHGVIHHELKRARKAKREHRRQMWWPLVSTQGGMVASQIAGGGQAGKRKNSGAGPSQLSFPGVLHGGRESLSRLGKLAASRHVHMLVVLLLPAKLLLLGALRIVVNFG